MLLLFFFPCPPISGATPAAVSIQAGCASSVAGAAVMAAAWSAANQITVFTVQKSHACVEVLQLLRHELLLLQGDDGSVPDTTGGAPTAVADYTGCVRHRYSLPGALLGPSPHSNDTHQQQNNGGTDEATFAVVASGSQENSHSSKEQWQRSLSRHRPAVGDNTADEAGTSAAHPVEADLSEPEAAGVEGAVGTAEKGGRNSGDDSGATAAAETSQPSNTNSSSSNSSSGSSRSVSSSSRTGGPETTADEGEAKLAADLGRSQLLAGERKWSLVEVNLSVHRERRVDALQLTNSLCFPQTFFNNFLVGSLQDVQCLQQHGKLQELLFLLLDCYAYRLPRDADAAGVAVAAAAARAAAGVSSIQLPSYIAQKGRSSYVSPSSTCINTAKYNTPMAAAAAAAAAGRLHFETPLTFYQRSSFSNRAEEASRRSAAAAGAADGATTISEGHQQQQQRHSLSQFLRSSLTHARTTAALMRTRANTLANENSINAEAQGGVEGGIAAAVAPKVDKASVTAVNEDMGTAHSSLSRRSRSRGRFRSSSLISFRRREVSTAARASSPCSTTAFRCDIKNEENPLAVESAERPALATRVAFLTPQACSSTPGDDEDAVAPSFLHAEDRILTSNFTTVPGLAAAGAPGSTAAVASGAASSSYSLAPSVYGAPRFNLRDFYVASSASWKQPSLGLQQQLQLLQQQQQQHQEDYTGQLDLRLLPQLATPLRRLSSVKDVDNSSFRDPFRAGSFLIPDLDEEDEHSKPEITTPTAAGPELSEDQQLPDGVSAGAAASSSIEAAAVIAAGRGRFARLRGGPGGLLMLRRDQQQQSRQAQQQVQGKFYSGSRREKWRKISYSDLLRLLLDILPIAEHTHFFKVHKQTFTGSEALDAFCDKLQFPSREAALRFGSQLLQQSVIQCVGNPDQLPYFEDSANALYRMQLHQEPSVLNWFIIWKKPAPNCMRLIRFLHSFWNALQEAHTEQTTGLLSQEDLKRDERYLSFQIAVCELQTVKLLSIRSEALKKAFFINVCNLLAQHALIEGGAPTDTLSRTKFFNTFSYCVGGFRFTVNELLNGVLRCNRRACYSLTKPFGFRDQRLQFILQDFDPRIHFALNFGARSCPPLRFYEADSIDEELRIASENFLNSSENVEIDSLSRVLWLNKLFSWYETDFGSTNLKVAVFVATFLHGSKKSKLFQLIQTSKGSPTGSSSSSSSSTGDLDKRGDARSAEDQQQQEEQNQRHSAGFAAASVVNSGANTAAPEVGEDGLTAMAAEAEAATPVVAAGANASTTMSSKTEAVAASPLSLTTAAAVPRTAASSKTAAAGNPAAGTTAAVSTLNAAVIRGGNSSGGGVAFALLNKFLTRSRSSLAAFEHTSPLSQTASLLDRSGSSSTGSGANVSLKVKYFDYDWSCPQLKFSQKFRGSWIGDVVNKVQSTQQHSLTAAATASAAAGRGATHRKYSLTSSSDSGKSSRRGDSPCSPLSMKSPAVKSLKEFTQQKFRMRSQPQRQQLQQSAQQRQPQLPRNATKNTRV